LAAGASGIEGGRAAAQARERPVRRSLGGLLAVVRQIVGAPDYGRYLVHHAACHPGTAPLSAREHYLEFVSRRFGGGATRCC